ncbi:MAG: hypothetical protein WC662_04300, partial [Candidatus Paceibacterota bacterium]
MENDTLKQKKSEFSNLQKQVASLGETLKKQGKNLKNKTTLFNKLSEKLSRQKKEEPVALIEDVNSLKTEVAKEEGEIINLKNEATKVDEQTEKETKNLGDLNEEKENIKKETGGKKERVAKLTVENTFEPTNGKAPKRNEKEINKRIEELVNSGYSNDVAKKIAELEFIEIAGTYRFNNLINNLNEKDRERRLQTQGLSLENTRAELKNLRNQKTEIPPQTQETQGFKSGDVVTFDQNGEIVDVQKFDNNNKKSTGINPSDMFEPVQEKPEELPKNKESIKNLAMAKLLEGGGTKQIDQVNKMGANEYSQSEFNPNKKTDSAEKGETPKPISEQNPKPEEGDENLNEDSELTPEELAEVQKMVTRMSGVETKAKEELKTGSFSRRLKGGIIGGINKIENFGKDKDGNPEKG